MQTLDAALEYAELGYRVFPCVKGQKIPATADGFKSATCDEDVIGAWFSTGEHNVAIATQSVTVIDIDGRDNPWIHSLDEDQLDELMDCPAQQTPSGGYHLFFAGSTKCTTGAVADKVDTRSDGGYVVAAPSTREGGGGYVWLPDRELVPIDKLPELPDWLAELIEARESQPVVSSSQERDEPIPSGQRNSALTQEAGRLRRIGYPITTVEAALQSINAERCSPPLDAREVRRIAESVCRYKPSDEDDDYEPDLGSIEAFPAELLDVGGFMGEVARYTNETSHRKQPILALAGAISLMATLSGRKRRDEYGTRPNLYIVGVAPSGAGKDRSRQVNKAILYAAEAGDLIGPERAASQTGVVSALVESPTTLFQFDEFGRYMKSITHKTASNHQTDIITTFMRLYSSSNQKFVGDAYADMSKNVAIDQPSPVLFGTTVPRPLYTSLTADNLEDGFLSRVLIFQTPDGHPDLCRPLEQPVPDELVATAKAWREEECLGGPLSNIPEPVAVRHSDEAKTLAERWGRQFESRVQEGGSQAVLWTRAGEKAAKLALLHALSLNRDARWIDAESIHWGYTAAHYLTEQLEGLAKAWIAEGRHEAGIKAVLRWLRDRPNRQASKREALRGPLRSYTPREREQVVNDLVGLYGVREVMVETKGRPRSLLSMPRSLLAAA